MTFDAAEWKRKLADVLREHPDIGRSTGLIEINMGQGGITSAYMNRRFKNISDIKAHLDQTKDKIDSATVRTTLG